MSKSLVFRTVIQISIGSLRSVLMITFNSMLSTMKATSTLFNFKHKPIPGEYKGCTKLYAQCLVMFD